MRQELTSTAGFPAFMFCENFNKTNSLDLILSAPVLLLLVVHFVMAKQRWWWFEARVADPPLQCGLSETPPQWTPSFLTSIQHTCYRWIQLLKIAYNWRENVKS